MTREEFNFIIDSIIKIHPCGLCKYRDACNIEETSFEISDEAWRRFSEDYTGNVEEVAKVIHEHNKRLEQGNKELGKALDLICKQVEDREDPSMVIVRDKESLKEYYLEEAKK